MLGNGVIRPASRHIGRRLPSRSRQVLQYSSDPKSKLTVYSFHPERLDFSLPYTLPKGRISVITPSKMPHPALYA
jgi:hypothetical protein